MLVDVESGIHVIIIPRASWRISTGVIRHIASLSTHTRYSMWLLFYSNYSYTVFISLDSLNKLTVYYLKTRRS